MTRDDMQERIARINAAVAILAGATLFKAELNARIGDLTEQLIENDNEQTRGRIKGIREVLDLGQALQFEREALEAALSEQSDAAQ